MKARGHRALGLGAKVQLKASGLQKGKRVYGVKRGKGGGDKSKGPTRSLRGKGMKLKNKPPVLVPYRGPPGGGPAPARSYANKQRQSSAPWQRCLSL